MPPSMIDLVRDLGPLVAILIFFIWRDYDRERKLSARIRALEDYCQETLTGLLKQTLAATHDQITSNRELRDAFLRRPCLREENIERRAPLREGVG